MYSHVLIITLNIQIKGPITFSINEVIPVFIDLIADLISNISIQYLFNDL